MELQVNIQLSHNQVCSLADCDGGGRRGKAQGCARVVDEAGLAPCGEGLLVLRRGLLGIG
jgi:hypothetical protein